MDAVLSAALAVPTASVVYALVGVVLLVVAVVVTRRGDEALGTVVGILGVFAVGYAAEVAGLFVQWTGGAQ